ncbi:hypothetical protein ACHAWT_000901 [Skeletonema menzelii]
MKQNNQALPSSSSSGGDKKSKRGGRNMIRLEVLAICVVALVFFILTLQLTLIPSESEEATQGIVHKSLRDFDRKAANETETETQLVTVTKKDKDDPQTSMYKVIDRSKRIEVPDKDRSLAFVHIGKSGGSTISLLLRNGCIQAVDGESCEAERWKKFPGKVGETETIASQRIQFYLHTGNVESGKMAEYYARVSSVVVVARDPFDRWISAFLSRHPRNIDGLRARNNAARHRAEMNGETPPIWAQKRVFGIDGPRNDQIHREAYNGCYPNVQEFINCATMDEPPSEKDLFHTQITYMQRGFHQEEITLNCREVCKEIVAATSRHIQHVRINYNAYLKDLPSNKEVFVIRTKSLWQDWVKVNNLLGSPEDVPMPDSVNEGKVVNSQGKLPVTSNLSNEGRESLCKFLRNEYILYIDLLNRAVNLSDDDIMSALDIAHRNCPAILDSIGQNS